MTPATDARVVSLRSFAREGRPAGRIVLPDDVVRVDRGTPWGNPYRIGSPLPPTLTIGDTTLVDGGHVTAARDRTIRVDEVASMRDASAPIVDRELAVLLYRGHAEAAIARDPEWLAPLRGKRLACWCAPMLCHGDVLVELGA